MGKIYAGAVAQILETVDGEDGEWFRVVSGNVEGYMKSEFFLRLSHVGRPAFHAACRPFIPGRVSCNIPFRLQFSPDSSGKNRYSLRRDFKEKICYN